MGKCKEEDKIEKLIRGSLKLPENRRCINCNSLGPQYVCTTFWTFVCTNCSGVHREFTHRVKSVSMAKFSMEEVNSLQAGGNEKAREIYFKTWNPHRNFHPDNSNIQRLRDFIKHVYVDKRFSGESKPVLLPRLRNDDKDESYERSRQDTYRERALERYSRHANDEGRSPGHPRDSSDRYSRYANNDPRSPGYRKDPSDRYGKYAYDEVRSPGYTRESSDRYSKYTNDEVRIPGYLREISSERYSRYGNDEVRSPGYPRENSRPSGLRASSSRFEGTDGRYQVDDARIAGRSATQMFTTEDIKPRGKSPVHHRSRCVNSPPAVRNVRELLGENFMSLRVGDQDRRSGNSATNAQVGDYSGHNSPRDTGGQSKTTHKRSISANVQNAVRTGNAAPARNDSLKAKSGSVGSLIDFASFPNPPDNVSTQNQRQEIQVPTDGVNSVSTETPVEENVPNLTPKNTLEFLLFELAAPVETSPAHQSGAFTNENAAPSHQLALTLPGDRRESSHSASTQEVTNTPNASAASTANRFDTVSTGAPQFSHVEQPNAPTSQMVPDFLGDDSVSSFNATSNQQSPSTQQQDIPSTTVPDCSSAVQTSHLYGNSNDQATNFFPALGGEASFDNPAAQSSNPTEAPMQETDSAVGVQPPTEEAKPSGRPELPADIFASLYPSSTMSAPGWQMNPSYSMGFNMQYDHNSPMQTAPFPSAPKSVNPFDINDNAAQFTMISPVQSGLPNVSDPSGILRTHSFGSHHQGFPPAQSPSYQSGAYEGHYSYSNIPPSSQQEIGGFGVGGATMGTLIPNQQLPYRYPAPADPRPCPTGGGNPFG